MDDSQSELTGLISSPDSFVELVRDALLHLYDLTYLQTHPLVDLCAQGQSARVGGKALRQALLDAIGATHPGPGVSTSSRAWRSYRILELRYVVGNEVDEVIGEVALSKRQYHREHHRALEAVASILWQNWHPTDARIDSLTRPSVDETSAVDLARSDLARFEAEHLLRDDATGQIDPAEVLRGVADLLRPLCVQRNVTLALELPDRLQSLRGDRVALRQGLLSTLTPLVVSAGPSAIRVAVTSRPGQLEVRVDAAASASAEPCLRGLEQGRPFIEALGGTVECQPPTEPNGVISIRFSFPTLDRPTLLVVDNHGDFIRLIERYLVGLGWNVVGAGDVEQAFVALRQWRPTAVLLDVVLPGRDGWDLLLRLKGSPELRETPVIICSVLREAEIAISLGAAAYLCKPVDQRQLIQTLELVLG